MRNKSAMAQGCEVTGSMFSAIPSGMSGDGARLVCARNDGQTGKTVS